jgi:hypothetical protein
MTEEILSLEEYREKVEEELRRRVGISIDEDLESNVDACFVAEETPTECVDWLIEKFDFIEKEKYVDY